MHADLTRDTFDPARHFASVVFQQGRVPLDADLNEQSAILLHYLRCLAHDLIGDHGGPRNGRGFEVMYDSIKGELTVFGPGRYYAQGVLLEIEHPILIPLGQREPGAKPLEPPFLVWLEGWERLVTAVQDPRLREPALGGPDTAARAQVAWRINTMPLPRDGMVTGCGDAWDLVGKRFERLREPRGTLRVMAGSPRTDTHDPCILPPDARYRGLENQLYRIEVHTGGRLGQPGEGKLAEKQGADGRLTQGAEAGPGEFQKDAPPTFKWSRENGSVTLALRSLRGDAAEVETFGLDPRLDLQPGDWVEVLDDELALPGRDTVLAQVEDVDRDEMRVMLRADSGMDLPEYEPGDPLHPLLRRWDQTAPVTIHGEGGAKKTDGLADGVVVARSGWIELEDGIRVRFAEGAWYEPGDHWLVPARVATGDVEWPHDDDGSPAEVPARRRVWVASPLGIVRGDGSVDDCRQCITPVSGPCFQIK